MLASVDTDNPLALLRSWLEENRLAGAPWSPEDFAYLTWLACRETGSRTWIWPIIETAPAWRRAYIGESDGALERFELASFHQSPSDD